MPASRAVEKMNQGVEWRKAANPSSILIFGDLVEKSRSIEREQSLDKVMILGFDPLEKVIRDRLSIAKLPPDVSKIDAGDETNLPRFFFRRLAQGAQESPYR